jgi:glucosamine-phosphate N-acetyltransferase
MIRLLEEKDITQVLKLLEQLTIVYEKDFDPITIFNNLPNTTHIFVYEEDNKIIGVATLLIEQKFIHSGGKVGHIEDVVVDKDCRECGVGKKLLQHCIQTAKENDCYKVILDCEEYNQAFYEKCGFKKYSLAMKIVL